MFSNNTLNRTAVVVASAAGRLDVHRRTCRRPILSTWVTNGGPSLAPNVVLVQSMPDTSDFGFSAPVAGGGASCSALVASVFTCTLGALGSGEGFSVLVTATVDAIDSQAYTTTASAYSAAPPTTIGTPAEDTLVQAQGDLIVTKFADSLIA
jgi:hypothetical protein